MGQHPELPIGELFSLGAAALPGPLRGTGSDRAAPAGLTPLAGHSIKNRLTRFQCLCIAVTAVERTIGVVPGGRTCKV
jgi:hypothetical protein